MLIRDATNEDLVEVSKRSMSRPPKNRVQPFDLYQTLVGDDGEILAVGGLRQFQPGVARAWVNFSEDAKPDFRRVYRMMREWLDLKIVELDLHRVEATCRPDFPEAMNMLDHLMFWRESVQQDLFAPGENGLLFVRLRLKENFCG
jgi:hypothetical protein